MGTQASVQATQILGTHGIPWNRILNMQDAVYDVKYAQNGEILATCSRDNTIRVWEASACEN